MAQKTVWLRANLLAHRTFAARNGVSFSVTTIPIDFEGGDSLDFSQAAMQQVYDLGHQRALSGDAWRTELNLNPGDDAR